MLQFILHAEEDAVWERTLRANFLNVEAWFPYINHYLAAIKITNIQNLITNIQCFNEK